MSYAFPLNATKYDRDFAWWENGYTPAEMDKIIELGEALPKKEGTIGSGAVGKELHARRDSSVAWMAPNTDTAWIFQRFYEHARQLNHKFFGFDLWGFEDALQYTSYEFKPESPKGGQHYDWHIDMAGSGLHGCRKLSMVLQLYDPMDYEGGELWIDGLTRQCLKKQRGLVYAFPGYVKHRVTPVTAGLRRSVVAWAVGPDLR